MFKRILYDDWLSIVPIAAFVLTFGGFVYFTIRALSISKDQRERMASLPLDLDPREEDPQR